MAEAIKQRVKLRFAQSKPFGVGSCPQVDLHAEPVELFHGIDVFTAGERAKCPCPFGEYFRSKLSRKRVGNVDVNAIPVKPDIEALTARPVPESARVTS